MPLIASELFSCECPACAGHITRFAFKKHGFVFHRCQSCYSLFVASALTEQLVHSSYSESYYENASAPKSPIGGVGGYASYLGLQDSLAHSFLGKLSLVRRYCRHGLLLDAGAAYGTFLKLAGNHYSAFGLEISHYAAVTARRLHGVPISVGNIERAPYASARFDAVVMWDIIEHLIRPRQALKEVHRMLRPGGVVLISTDDANNWLPRSLGRRWWAISPPLHLCHFSRSGIQAALEAAGQFTVVEFHADRRRYRVSEIIDHFGTAYGSKVLRRVALALGKGGLGSLSLSINRPEQFVAVAIKAHDSQLIADVPPEFRVSLERE